MNEPRLERNTLMFPHCWVCSRRFTSSTPAGPANREDHHVFPRNAGGTDGPLVSLCDSDHSTLHKVAKRLQGKRPFTDLMAGRPLDQQQKLAWLASMVVKAEANASGDANKRFNNSISLSVEDTRMMKRLQKVYPKLGRSDIFSLALRRLYVSYFGK